MSLSQQWQRKETAQGKLVKLCRTLLKPTVHPFMMCKFANNLIINVTIYFQSWTELLEKSPPLVKVTELFVLP